LTGSARKPNLKLGFCFAANLFFSGKADAILSNSFGWAAMTPIPYDWQYLPLLMQILAAILLGAGMIAASWFVGRHRNTRVKLDAYECGIQAVGDARGRFSVRFYLVAVLFILFDVEMVFMMPWAVIYRRLPALTGCSRLFGFWEMLVYLGFVAVGLYYIVRKGILNWSQDKADL
jgi:NADH-quinone oxidoreductase subunit A